uniref:Uncharacterized protein n=1 Tax=Arundo donax TaxID=35708 RepID=A0A0A9EHJ0_ARUDO
MKYIKSYGIIARHCNPKRLAAVGLKQYPDSLKEKTIP